MEISFSLHLHDSSGEIIDDGIFLFIERTRTILKLRNSKELDDMIDELHDVRRQLKNKII